MDTPRHPPELVEHGPMVPAPYELVAKVRDTIDTWTLQLEARSGDPLRFAPGQVVMLSAGGGGEVPISSSGPPAANVGSPLLAQIAGTVEKASAPVDVSY